MKYIISYSGGLGSAVSVLLAHKHGLDYDPVFADTLIEDEDLYRLNDDIERVTGVTITRLTDGRTPWDVFADKKYIGNTRTAHCSSELKTKQVRNYIDSKYKNNWAIKLVLGMGANENDRLERARKNWFPIPVISLLDEYKIYSRRQILNIMGEYGIRIPRLYDQGYPHNNCGGFCVRAGQTQFLTLLLTNPERYLYHEKKMEETINKIGATARPFLRVVKNYKTFYVTLREFRVMYEAGEIKVDPYDFGGCGCFVDE